MRDFGDENQAEGEKEYLLFFRKVCFDIITDSLSYSMRYLFVRKLRNMNISFHVHLRK